MVISIVPLPAKISELHSWFQFFRRSIIPARNYLFKGKINLYFSSLGICRNGISSGRWWIQDSVVTGEGFKLHILVGTTKVQSGHSSAVLCCSDRWRPGSCGRRLRTASCVVLIAREGYFCVTWECGEFFPTAVTSEPTVWPAAPAAPAVPAVHLNQTKITQFK